MIEVALILLQHFKFCWFSGTEE